MLIKEIELNNFRIYKGSNRINILPRDNKNVIILKAKNGSGKTTLLTSLVWCLYGKQMDLVDEQYKHEMGGRYSNYLDNSLNQMAKNNGETTFSVSITLTDVKIPDISCQEIKITRMYDISNTYGDKVEILIDGTPNELVQSLRTRSDKQDGEEIFIRDFILPIEIAKFFFFDAEKIVSLSTNIDSKEQRKALSKAYSEVLGIKKYEDLKIELEIIKEDYSKQAATPQDRQKLNQLETNIKNLQIKIEHAHKEKELLMLKNTENRERADNLLSRILKEGKTISEEDLTKLKNEQRQLEEDIESIHHELKDLFELLPFGLAGQTINTVMNQLKIESEYINVKYKQEDVEEKTKRIINDIDREKQDLQLYVDRDIRNFYEHQFEQKIKQYFFSEQYFFSDIPEVPDNIDILHDFSKSQIDDLTNLTSNLKQTFHDRFKHLNDNYKRTRREIDLIKREINNAEKETESKYVAEWKKEKKAIEDIIYADTQQIARLDTEIKESESLGHL